MGNDRPTATETARGRLSSSSSSSSISGDVVGAYRQRQRLRTFRYARDNDGDDGDAADGDNESSSGGEVALRLLRLGPRRSAELEDKIFSLLEKGGGGGGGGGSSLLEDPILKRSISRKGGAMGGLDWIRSVSVPSSSSTSIGVVGDGNADSESITVTLRVPTLLHPKLDELASDVAKAAREGVARLLNDDDDGERVDVRPEDVSVVVRMMPGTTTTEISTHAGDENNNDGVSVSGNGNNEKRRSGALRNVAHVVAVYSCKGGVGKSTVAANLAYQLASSIEGNNGGGGSSAAAAPARVGLCDLDVYGPSLPLLVVPDDPAVHRSPPHVREAMGNNDNAVEPIEYRGVKLMSLGYVSPDSGVPGSGNKMDGAAVLRGPMASRVASQLLHGTNWGDLDVLILDLPPGTGDVQLEVCQSVKLSGAVAVSTPSALAWADVMKGVAMFGELGVPSLAVVENMGYFLCEGGGRHYPFGKTRMGDGDDDGDGDGGSSSYARSFLPGPSHVFRLPVSTALNDANDSGTPLCCRDPNSGDGDDEDGGNAGEERAAFAALADAVAADLLLLRHGAAPLSARRGRRGDGVANAAVDVVPTVTLEGTGDVVEFDVAFTRLGVDNDGRSFGVRLFSDGGGYQAKVKGMELRRRDPRTGDVVVDDDADGGGDAGGPPSMVQQHRAADDEGGDGSDDGHLFPATVTKKGNYGYEVRWADGMRVIYSLLAIARAAGGRPAATGSGTGEDGP